MHLLQSIDRVTTPRNSRKACKAMQPTCRVSYPPPVLSQIVCSVPDGQNSNTDTDPGSALPSTSYPTPTSSAARGWFSRRAVLRLSPSLLGAVACVLSSGVFPPPSQASNSTSATEEGQLDGDLKRMMQEMRALLPRPVRELDDLLRQGDAVNLQALEAARVKVGFKRLPDGRLFVKSRAGKWYNVKNDMMARGYLLLQDAQHDCWFLPPGDLGDMEQVDLSDDMLVAMLFGTSAWEQVLRPLETEDAQGRVVQLRIGEAEFRQVLSLLEGADVSDESEDEERRS